jgi:hypothetical protein
MILFLCARVYYFNPWKINSPLQYRKLYFQHRKGHKPCLLRRKICLRNIKSYRCLFYESIKDLHTVCGQNAEIFHVTAVVGMKTTGLCRKNNLPITWLHMNIMTQTDTESSRSNSALHKLLYTILSMEHVLNSLQIPEIRHCVPPINLWFLKDSPNRGCIIK